MCFVLTTTTVRVALCLVWCGEPLRIAQLSMFLWQVGWQVCGNTQSEVAIQAKVSVRVFDNRVPWKHTWNYKWKNTENYPSQLTLLGHSWFFQLKIPTLTCSGTFYYIHGLYQFKFDELLWNCGSLNFLLSWALLGLKTPLTHFFWNFYSCDIVLINRMSFIFNVFRILNLF